ncbi:dTDP-4-dehydrorhamnose reductase [Patescibacteria group bacterium]|nr:dTDP-4-dehydrorhamnose reductase [Patescibacteria group bacterium]
MKILITGANGQLGTDFCKIFQDCDVIPLTHADIEITSMDSVEKALDQHKPDVVINTAAYVRVDDCETHPEKAFLVNAVGVKNIAEASQALGATLVRISTDYVFDGKKSTPYTEDDTPNPINIYGISKLAGEQYAKLAERYYIIRVSSLFGIAGARGKGGNFVETMIKKAKSKEKITVVDDVIISPTYTKDTARVIKKIIEEGLPYGIYHAANTGYCSWYEFTKKIFELLKWSTDLNPIKTEDLTLKAKRPIFSALENRKLPSYSLKMSNWHEALREYLYEKDHL